MALGINPSLESGVRGYTWGIEARSVTGDVKGSVTNCRAKAWAVFKNKLDLELELKVNVTTFFVFT